MNRRRIRNVPHQIEVGVVPMSDTALERSSEVIPISICTIPKDAMSSEEDEREYFTNRPNSPNFIFSTENATNQRSMSTIN